MESGSQLIGFDLVCGQSYVLDYTNYKGVRAEREIELVKIVWGTDKFHSGKLQMLLVAKAKDRPNEQRNFALSGVHSIRKATTNSTRTTAEPTPASKPDLREILIARLDQFASELVKEEHAALHSTIAACRSSVLYAAPEMGSHLWLLIAQRVHRGINENDKDLIARWQEIMNAPVV